jgi:hypothetical protein
MTLETTIISTLGELTVFKGLTFVAVSEISLFVFKIAKIVLQDSGF